LEDRLLISGIRWTLAEMAIQIQAARLLIYDAAIKVNQGKGVAKEAAMERICKRDVGLGGR